MKKIKKFGNVAPMLIILLLVVILSYFIEGRNGISYIALGDLVLNYSHSFYYFFDAVLLVLAVGGLYGALNKIPAYKKLLNGIVKKIGDKKKLFVIIFTIFFVLLTAFGGFNLLAWLFIPFVVSIVLLLGYDKFVALSSTVAATFIGAIGGFVLSFRDSTNQYASTYTTFDKAVGLSNIWSNFIPKLLLLIGGTVLLVLFIIKHIKDKDKEKVEEVSNNDVFYVEARTKTGVIIKEDYSDVKVWPLIVFGCLLLVILVLGFIPWNDLFGFTCFDRFHTWLTGLKIGNYAVFTGLISANLTAFGRWYDVGGYLMVITCITLFLLIMKCFYHVKFKELTKGFIYGVKKLIPAVMVMVLAYSILVATYNNGFMETIINKAGDSFGDNAINRANSLFHSHSTCSWISSSSPHLLALFSSPI